LQQVHLLQQTELEWHLALQSIFYTQMSSLQAPHLKLLGITQEGTKSQDLCNAWKIQEIFFNKLHIVFGIVQND
jgi:hypothetical protein